MSKKLLHAALVGFLSAGAVTAQLPVMKQQGVVEPQQSYVTRTILTVKVFPVGDLVCPPKGSPLVEPGDDAAMQAAAKAYTNARVEAVKKQILTTVDVDTWNETGIRRFVQYSPADQSLLVMNEVDTLTRVGECLETMRKVRSAQVLVEVTLFKVPCEADEVKKIFGDKQTSAMTSEELNTLIDGLKKNGQINIITAPKITVANMRTGGFETLQKLPNDDRSVGVSCKVTPDVASDMKSIRLKLEVTNSTHNPTLVNLGNGQKVQAVDSQQTATSVDMKDGGTCAVKLGIHKAEQKVEQKIPFLGDVPYIGRLFRNTGIKMERMETIAVFTASQVKPMNASVYPPLPASTPHVITHPSLQQVHAVMPQQAASKHYLSHPPTQLVQAALPSPIAVVEPTMAAYQAACAAGKKGEAMELALQLLKKDPTCFGKCK